MRTKRRKQNIFNWILCLSWYKNVQSTALFCKTFREGSSCGHRFWQPEKSILLSEEQFFCPMGRISLTPALSNTPWQPGHIRDIVKKDVAKSTWLGITAFARNGI